MTPTITMKFKVNEPVSIKVEGALGETCHSLTAPYEANWARQLSSTPTAEATATVAVEDQVQQQH